MVTFPSGLSAPKLRILKNDNKRVEQATMDMATLQTRIEQIRAKREVLVKLLDQPNLGTLRIDVNQALEEMDDLIEEFDKAFKPE